MDGDQPYDNGLMIWLADMSAREGSLVIYVRLRCGMDKFDRSERANFSFATKLLVVWRRLSARQSRSYKYIDT